LRLKTGWQKDIKNTDTNKAKNHGSMKRGLKALI
jgi:hypothetical protein